MENMDGEHMENTVVESHVCDSLLCAKELRRTRNGGDVPHSAPLLHRLATEANTNTLTRAEITRRWISVLRFGPTNPYYQAKRLVWREREPIN